MKKILVFFLTGLAFTLNSCAPSTAETIQSPIKGKFVFQGMRDGIGSKYLATFLSKDQKVLKITEDVGRVAWSPDGSRFVVTAPDHKRITFFDSRGNTKSSFSTRFSSSSIDWFLDEKRVIFVDEESKKTALPDTFHLMILDIESKILSEVLLLENDQTIFDLFLSPDNKKVAMTIGSVVNPNVKNRASIFDLESKTLKDLTPEATVIGWFPDGIDIAVTTNTRPDGKWIGSPHGVLARVNVETREFKIIKEQKYEASDDRLSKDGKYTFYSNSVSSGGSAIFVRSIETDEVTQITRPVPIGLNRYSKDSNPDWYQGDK